jgi:hypothetical protein
VSRFYKMIDKKPRNPLVFSAALVLFLVLTGCSGLSRTMQPLAGGGYILEEGSPVGQTFVAGYDGLEGFQAFLSPEKSGNGTIWLYLREGVHSGKDLASVSLPLSDINGANFYSFHFTPQPGSQREYYYAFLEVKGEGAVQVGSSLGETYLEGALYQGHIPQDAQMTFRLSYNLALGGLGLFKLFLSWIPILGVGVLLFVMPGWALLSWLWEESKTMAWPVRLGLSAGTSLAIYPILLLLFGLIRWQAGGLAVWLPIALGLCYPAWLGYSFAHKKQPGKWDWKKHLMRIPWAAWFSAPHLAFLFLAALIVFTRFWAVRNLDAPMWGDSYQHTLIAKLIVENGGLFSSWQPYADLDSFTYHFGFHSLAAAFHRLTGFDLPQAILWTGQLLNVLAVLALYPLAVRIGRSPWAGVLAVVLAGLFSPMPMTYVNWGRYTQLAGQVILPAVVLLSWAAFPKQSKNGRLLLLCAVLMAGLALTHYRVLILAVLFFPTLFLMEGLQKKKTLAYTRSLAWVGGVGGLLFLPWFIHVFGGRVMGIFTQHITTDPRTAPQSIVEYNQIGDVFAYLPAWMWLLLPVSFGWLMWRRRKDAAVTGLWWLIILLAANPQWLDLPGAGVLSSFTVFIAAYIPAALLTGAAGGDLIEYLRAVPMEERGMEGTEEQGRLPLFNIAVSAILILTISLAGMRGVRQRLGDVQIASHSMVTRPDVRAAEWIRENTPEDALFLVNSFFAYGGSVVVGSDGGWWLPLLAERRTTLPPLNYGLERDPWPGYRQWVNSLALDVRDKGLQHVDVLASLEGRKITHIYIGQQHGRVNYSGPDFLDPELLLNSPDYSLVYHQDRVMIFEVGRQP